MTDSTRKTLIFIGGMLLLIIPLAILVRARIDLNTRAPSTIESQVPDVSGPSEPAPSPVAPEPEAPEIGTPDNAVTSSSPTINDERESLQFACEAAGGRWNECASACRNAPPGTACIMMCVQVCECESSAQCPSGTVCEEKDQEGVGVCK